MSGEKQYSKNFELDGLIQSLNEYSDLKGIITAKIHPEVEEIVNLTEDDLKKLKPEECLRKAFLLSGYCGYVQKVEHDHLFGKYMKWEQKLHTLSINDDFAESVMKAKSTAENNITWIDNKVRDMRRQVDALMELGRRRY